MGRSTRYLEELRFAWARAEGLRPRAALCLATLAFHAGNLLKRPASRTPHAYPVRLGDATRDLRLRTHGGDLFVFYEVLLDRCYRLPRAVPAPRTIVDLGANVGLTTLFYAAEYPGARFVCVEPDPANAVLLRHNVRSLGSAAAVVEAAAAARPGPVFFRTGAGTWGGTVTEEEDATSRIEATTLPELRRLYQLDHIDLLKVDIEGSEQALFADCSEWIDAVSTIIIELHGDYSIADFTRHVSSSGLMVLEPTGPKGETAMLVAVRR